MIAYADVKSPVGPLMLAADENGLRCISFRSGARQRWPERHWIRVELEKPEGSSRDGSGPASAETLQPTAARAREPADAMSHLACAALQLGEYFSGTRRSFHLRLTPEGTPFQRSVWRALSDIPYGETISYGELARRVGKPSAARAVGAANGCNPLPIVVPCHRVIGADGSLTGFGGGLEAKRMLLARERRFAPATVTGSA